MKLKYTLRVFDSSVMDRFLNLTDRMWIEGWVKALHDVYSAPVIIRVIKSWNM
jgi:hypothetical protein